MNADDAAERIIQNAQPRICRTRFNLLQALYKQRKYPRSLRYLALQKALGEHYDQCPTCQEFMNSFPTEDPNPKRGKP